MQETTDKTFKKDVLEESMKRPVLVDFWASWCAPCRQMSPRVESFAEENKNVSVVKMNIEDNSDIPTKFNIQTIPTFILFVKGEVKDIKTGTLSKGELANLV